MNTLNDSIRAAQLAEYRLRLAYYLGDIQEPVCCSVCDGDLVTAGHKHDCWIRQFYSEARTEANNQPQAEPAKYERVILDPDDSTPAPATLGLPGMLPGKRGPGRPPGGVGTSTRKTVVLDPG